jgi:glycosyl transferase family 25
MGSRTDKEGPMPQQIPIYVISLARNVERRAFITSHLESLDLAYTLVEGVDGRAMPEAERDALVSPAFRQSVGTVNPGIVGCYLSHVRVYQMIADRNDAVSLILEDDAVLTTDAVGLIRGGVAEPQFDYCFLDSDDRGVNPVYFDADDRVPLGHGYAAYRLSEGPLATHALLISRTAAARRLDQAVPIREQIDCYRYLDYAPRFYAIVGPKLAGVSLLSLQSDTSRRDETKPPVLLSLRRHGWFRTMRDWLKLRPVKAAIERRDMISRGLLTSGKRWRRVPPGREVLG